MAYVGNMGASGAFGALADFIKNRRGFKQETEDRQLKAEMAKLQQEALRTATRGAQQTQGFDADLHPGVRRAQELGNTGQEITNTFNAAANPKRLGLMDQDAKINDRKLLDYDLDISSKTMQNTALGNTHALQQSGKLDVYGNPDHAALAALGGVDSRGMINEGRRIAAEGDLIKQRGVQDRLNIGASGAVQERLINHRVAAEAGLTGIPSDVAKFLQTNRDEITSKAWEPYLQKSAALDRDLGGYAESRMGTLDGNTQLKNALAARQQEVAAAHTAAVQTANELIALAEQQIAARLKPGTPEYQTALAYLQQAKQPIAAPPIQRAPTGPPQF